MFLGYSSIILYNSMLTLLYYTAQTPHWTRVIVVATSQKHRHTQAKKGRSKV